MIALSNYVANQGDQMRPYISVVIFAYNRQNYWTDAVESVLHQTLSRSKFEIIVVRNFTDERKDNCYRMEGVLLVQCSSPNIGEFVLTGLSASSGEVLSFLDDDDTFERTKLEHLYNEFIADNNLAFYNHRFNYTSIGRTVVLPSEAMTSASKCVIDLTSWMRLSKGIRETILHNFGNNSCISVRKHVLVQVRDYLLPLRRSLDTFLLFTSAFTKSKVLITKETLTNYRATVGSSIMAEDLDFPGYLAAKREVIDISVADFEVMRHMTINTEIGPFADYLTQLYRLNRCLYDYPKANRRDIMVNLILTILKNPLQEPISHIQSLSLAFLSFFAPRLVQKLSYSSHLRLHQTLGY